MANEEQLRILRQGVAAWNTWRVENPQIRIDLCGADLRCENLVEVNLREADLSKVDLNGADLHRANLDKTNLYGAYLNGADLSDANLNGVNLSGAEAINANLQRSYFREAILSEASLEGANFHESDLSGADLRWTSLCSVDFSRAILCGVNFSKSDLRWANFSEANLSKANLENASMIEVNLDKADLTNCKIYGISAWGLKLKDTKQKDLIITPPGESVITVDNLEVAQFIYLLLHNEKIRNVIDTITSKVVLILGRFTPERKAVLDTIREELRKRDYLPVSFDFERPVSCDITETVSTLAHLARFIIADISGAKSVIEELEHIVPQLYVPVQPLVLDSDYDYALFGRIRKFPWVLEPYQYKSQEELLTTLEAKIIIPTEKKAAEFNKDLENERTGSSGVLSYIISYSWRDKDFAIQLYSDLTALGAHCQLFERDKLIGASWAIQIDRTIQSQQKLLFVISKTSINKPWISEEISKAFELERARQTAFFFPIFLFPVESEDPDLYKILTRDKEIQIGTIFDFSQWQDKNQYKNAFSKLVRDLTLRAAVDSKRRE
jgi:uncharacterized protein YjbI with pentapeptide repeats